MFWLYFRWNARTNWITRWNSEKHSTRCSVSATNYRAHNSKHDVNYNEKKNYENKNEKFTGIVAWMSYFLPFLPINRHVNWSVAACDIWKRSWFFGNTSLSILRSNFNESMLAILPKTKKFDVFISLHAKNKMIYINFTVVYRFSLSYRHSLNQTMIAHLQMCWNTFSFVWKS